MSRWARSGSGSHTIWMRSAHGLDRVRTRSGSGPPTVRIGFAYEWDQDRMRTGSRSHVTRIRFECRQDQVRIRSRAACCRTWTGHLPLLARLGWPKPARAISFVGCAVHRRAERRVGRHQRGDVEGGAADVRGQRSRRPGGAIDVRTRSDRTGAEARLRLPVSGGAPTS